RVDRRRVARRGRGGRAFDGAHPYHRRGLGRRLGLAAAADAERQHEDALHGASLGASYYDAGSRAADRIHCKIMQKPDRPPLQIFLLATALGAGMSPKAPGTCGTLVAVPLAWALALGGQALFIGGTVVVSLVGIWAAEHYGRWSGKDDDQRIVIDEV